jgi:hypothetical protein
MQLLEAKLLAANEKKYFERIMSAEPTSAS